MMTTAQSPIAWWPSAEDREDFFRRYPEWWACALSGVAWVVLLFACWRHAGHAIHHRMGFGEELAHWLLMIAAMMLPLTRQAMWFTALGSLWRRRHRAIVGFLVGFFAPWLVLGVGVAALRTSTLWTHTYGAAAMVFVLALLWMMTPVYRRGLVACHRTYPLAPVGWRADRDCVNYGAHIGFWCCSTCWLMMAGCALAGHGLVALGGGMAVGMLERGVGFFWASRRVRLGCVLALAVWYGLAAGGGLL